MPIEAQQPIPVQSWRQAIEPTGETAALAQVRALATLMDGIITIPGTRFRVGLDALLGLIPGIGDLIGAGLSMYIVMTAARLGVSRVVLTRMLFNVGVDAILGAVPVVGDVFDAAWRSNLKNAALLERAVTEPRAARRASWLTLAGIAVAVVALVAGGIALAVWLVRYLIVHVG